MPDNKLQIVFKNIEIVLKKVEFKKLEETSDKYHIVIKNKLKSKNVTETGFTLVASRKQEFEPVGAFEINIQYDMICELDDKSIKHYSGNLEEIKKFIKKRKIEIFNSLEVGSKMSVLISQLSLINDSKPIVTPPFIRPKELD